MENHSPQAVPEDTNGKLNDLLTTLWTRSRESIDERIRLLHGSSHALRANGADAAARRSGADSAHKLAGILGTFGLPEGTGLARQIEVTLESAAQLKAADVDLLDRSIVQLEQMIEAKSKDAGKRRA